MNNICAIPKLKSHHFVPKGIYITVYNNTVKQFKYFLKHHAWDTPSVKRWRRDTDEWNGYMERFVIVRFLFFFSPVSCLNKLFLDLLFFTWLGGSDAGWGGWSCGMCVWLVTDEWNGYMERSSSLSLSRQFRNDTSHDSCLSTTLQTRPPSSVSQSARTHTSHTGCMCALRSLGHGCVQEVKNYINTVRFQTQTARFVS